MNNNQIIKNGKIYTLAQLFGLEKSGALVSYFTKDHRADIGILGPDKNIKYEVLEYIEEYKYVRVIRTDQ
jgi:hypothetical protein